MNIRDWKVATRCACLDLARTLRRWLRASSGNVMIEAGFLIPLLILLAMGGYDFGRLALHKITVTNAARAGTQYGAQDPITAADTDGMKQSARNDAGDTEGVLTFEPPPRQFCACANEGEVACTAACADGSFQMLYVEVTVLDEVELLFPYPGIGSQQTVVSTSRMRVR